MEVEGPFTNFDNKALPFIVECFDQSLHRPVLCVDYEEVIVHYCHEEGEALLIIEWEQKGFTDAPSLFVRYLSHHLEMVDN